MGAIAKDRFVKLLLGDGEPDPGTYNRYSGQYAFRNPIKTTLASSGMVSATSLLNVNLNEESAVALYDQLREYTATRGYYPNKFLRPWDLDKDLYNDLDPNQAWWGFEFETGYTGSDTRGDIIRRVWDELNNTCFDGEGEGAAMCEITFAPQEVGKFVDRTAEAVKFMQIIDELRPTHVHKTDGINVGTHINISVPGLNRHNQGAITQIMNNTMTCLPTLLPGEDENSRRNTKMEFFGREQLYGLFYPQMAYAEAGTGNVRDDDPKNKYWLEGKLFRTTYYMSRFEQYMSVCEAITRCMEWLVKQDSKTLNRLKNKAKTVRKPAEGAVQDLDTGLWSDYVTVGNTGAYFSNFIEMVLEGADPVIANWNASSEVEDDGSKGLIKPFRRAEAVATPAVAEAA